MAALIAVDAREPLMQVTAVEKAFEDLDLYRPGELQTSRYDRMQKA
jgi:hypothetical protein